MTAITPMTAQEYDDYLDEEVKAFIDETNSWYPPGTHEKTISDQRVVYDNMCRAFFNGYPKGVSAKDIRAQHVPMRHYTNAGSNDAAVVLYAHGGSNMLGGLHSHDDVCADIAKATGLDVVAIDYRLSPEFSQQDSLEDCAIAVEWVRETLKRPIIMAGDSAGGYLVFGTALAMPNAQDIVGLTMVYSGYGQANAQPSMTRHANAPMLSADEVRTFQSLTGRDNEASEIDRPSVLSQVPPVYLAPAECDPICDVSVELAKCINDAGGYAVCHIDNGLVHGHLRARHRSKKAAESFFRFNEAISKMANGTFSASGIFGSNA